MHCTINIVFCMLKVTQLVSAKVFLIEKFLVVSFMQVFTVCLIEGTLLIN